MSESVAILACKQLAKRYGKVSALGGVTLAFQSGEIVCVLGVSGSGKSTLLRCLSLATRPDGGWVSFDGESAHFPVKPGSDAPRLQYPEITMVFQQLHLWPHLTLRENIDLPARYSPLDHACRADDLCEIFGIGGLLDRYPNQVSAGQRQRAALVRSLQLSSRCLLLDEVTSALDGVQVDRLASLLAQKRAAGTCVIMATHQLGFARACADRFVFIANGQVEASGNMQTIDATESVALKTYLRFA